MQQKGLSKMCWTWIARTVGLHIRWIVFNNVIYLLVRNIYTYPPL